MEQKSVGKTANAKKIAIKKEYKPQLVKRLCKIIDVIITEYMPKDSTEYVQYLTIILQDTDTSQTIACNLSISDMEKMGISMSTKSMVDLASWLKTHSDVIELNVMDNATKITYNDLIGEFNPEPEKVVEKLDISDYSIEHVEPEPTINLAESAVVNVKAVKKFGRKNEKNIRSKI